MDISPWIKIKNFWESRDARTGYLRWRLGQPGDFHGEIRQRPAGWEHLPSGKPRVVWVYDWSVFRQRTEREGPDDRGRHWDPLLVTGQADSLPDARRALVARMRELREAHIRQGGDVGYGDAPTGDQIRAELAKA